MNSLFQKSLVGLLSFLLLVSHLYAQRITEVASVGITVADLDREVAFFENVLDFKKVKEENLPGEAATAIYGPAGKNGIRIATLQLGAEKIHLMAFSTGRGRLVPSDSRSNDLWFQHLAIVVSDMDAAYQKLLQKRVQHVSTFPETLPDYLPNAAGIRAFYFRDPEGHNLELIWFPKDKGNPRWQPDGTQQALFLGIDHTAIAVSETAQSMAFYRDALGLVHGGHSENFGTEQEHLNQVFGARLDINGLHADTGFGVEFLRYLSPPGGRPIPADSRPEDLWHYQTELITDDLPGLLKKLGKPEKATETHQKSVLLRDPDGHALLISAREVN